MIEENIEAKRGPGRPPKAVSELPIKKGNPTWKPANVDDTFDKEDGFRYRWINEDQTNLLKKELEGWEIVSDIAGSKTKSEVGYGRINDGAQQTSVRKRVGQILARIPIEEAEKRDSYFNAKTDRSLSAMRKNMSAEMPRDKAGNVAPVHGSITIEKRGIKNVITD